MEINSEHINRRVQYTDRSGKVKYGTIKEIVNKFVNITLENSTRSHYFVPIDTLILVDEDGVPVLE
jgi:hypothetical protein